MLRGSTADILLVNLPAGSNQGLELVSEVKLLYPQTAVIAMTASGSVNAAVEAMRCGASDYLAKPFAIDELSTVLDRAASSLVTDTATRQLRERLRLSQGLGAMIGRSGEMEKLYRILSKVAQSSHPVLILGESGTGKEVFANAIHNASSRRRAPFLAINCAAMPEGLIESELFGYSDGSFTGARKGGQAGKFEMANGGTIFLDEIGEMSPGMQAKLLRVLQERTISRIGSALEIPVDIRIIAATHCDLGRDVAAGRFREDLYYRLAVLEVKIPPLRERRQDIPRLARALIAKLSARLERPPIEIDESCLQRLAACPWPGNVRQMENLLERALIRTRGGATLTAENLDLPELELPAPELPAPAPQLSLPEWSVPELFLPEPPLEGALRNAATGPAAPPPPAASSLREIEKQAIAEAIAACRGNIRQTAARLGIARNTLYRKMQDYGLLPSENR
jgi:two-component system response regulator HydG